MYGFVDMGEVLRVHTLYTAFSEEIQSDYFFAGERHDFWELVLVDRGEVGITAGEEALVLRAGQAVLHSPIEFHRVWYSGNGPGRIVIFSFGGEGIPVQGTGHFELTDPDRPGRLLEEIKQAFQFRGISAVGLRGQRLQGQAALKRLELFLLELLLGSGRPEMPDKSRSAENYARIVRCMEDNLNRNLSVDEIAQMCNMSCVNAKQTFSRYAGMGIRSYFNRLKIRAAIPMLQGGSSVQETAAALGFSSQNYFCTVFKRITGRPPTAYK